MRFDVRLTVLVFAPACLVFSLTSPVHAAAQNAPQVHAITGLPLPPDEEPATPATTPAVKPVPPVTVAPVPVKPTTKSTKKITPTPAPYPAPETPAVVTTPAAEPVPAPAPAVEQPTTKTRKTRTPKPIPAAATPVDNSVHAIMLPPPPDEEPSAAPKPVAVTPEPIKKLAVPVVKPEAAKSAESPAATPAVVPTPVAPTFVGPTPEPVRTKSATLPPTPATSLPAPVETTQPSNRPPIAPVPVPPNVRPLSPAVATPKTVVVPSSVVPDELLSKPVSAPPVTAKPIKPEPKLKTRAPKSSEPVTVTLPATVAKPSAKAAPESTPTAAETAPPPPPPPGTLAHIVFQGGAPFTQSELAPLTGLAIGEKPTSESLESATRRLIDTGLFLNVNASYETPDDIGTATFVIESVPASQLPRASFANFVWLTPAEIDATLKMLPLYHGSVPTGGNLRIADSIQATLEGALSARGVSAKITHTLIPPSPEHPYTSVEFRVTSPNVVLSSASLFDIPPALVNRTLKAQQDATKVPYNEGIAGTTITDLLLTPARSAGYIGAQLWHIERKRHGNGSTILVDYTARMNAGPIYTVRSLSWTPTPVLSEEDFRRISALHVGQVPSAVAAEQTQQAIQSAYYSQGYLEVYIGATQNLDAKTGAADYIYSVIPGPQYHLRSISIQGLAPEAQKDLEAVWTMKPGDVYDEEYLLNFLTNHTNLTSLKPYTFTYDRSTTSDTHQVDLIMTFKK